jgi:hypothetical protein
MAGNVKQEDLGLAGLSKMQSHISQLTGAKWGG